MAQKHKRSFALFGDSEHQTVGIQAVVFEVMHDENDSSSLLDAEYRN